jgi:hypothetical protein
MVYTSVALNYIAEILVVLGAVLIFCFFIVVIGTKGRGVKVDSKEKQILSQIDSLYRFLHT